LVTFTKIILLHQNIRIKVVDLLDCIFNVGYV
jgi:hypothetical protein